VSLSFCFFRAGGRRGRTEITSEIFCLLCARAVYVAHRQCTEFFRDRSKSTFRWVRPSENFCFSPTERNDIGNSPTQKPNHIHFNIFNMPKSSDTTQDNKTRANQSSARKTKWTLASVRTVPMKMIRKRTNKTPSHPNLPQKLRHIKFDKDFVHPDTCRCRPDPNNRAHKYDWHCLMHQRCAKCKDRFKFRANSFQVAQNVNVYTPHLHVCWECLDQLPPGTRVTQPWIGRCGPH
jgi:hypothetical protein